MYIIPLLDNHVFTMAISTCLVFLRVYQATYVYMLDNYMYYYYVSFHLPYSSPCCFHNEQVRVSQDELRESIVVNQYSFTPTTTYVLLLLQNVVDKFSCQKYTKFMVWVFTLRIIKGDFDGLSMGIMYIVDWIKWLQISIKGSGYLAPSHDRGLICPCSC